MRLCAPVVLLVILNGVSKSYTISSVYQNLSSRVLNDSRDLAVTTVSARLFHGLVTRIGNTFNDNAVTKIGVVLMIMYRVVLIT